MPFPASPHAQRCHTQKAAHLRCRQRCRCLRCVPPHLAANPRISGTKPLCPTRAELCRHSARGCQLPFCQQKSLQHPDCKGPLCAPQAGKSLGSLVQNSLGVRSPPGTRDRQLWLWRPSHGGVREASRRYPSSQGWAEGGPLERAPSLSLIFRVRSCLISTQKKKSLSPRHVSKLQLQAVHSAGAQRGPQAPCSHLTGPPPAWTPGATCPGEAQRGPSCKTLSSKQLYRILYIYTKIDPFIYACVLVTGTGWHD